jgi:hypothetical protein
MRIRNCNSCFWRHAALDMLFVFQFLFLLNVSWDFFLTVLLNTSQGALVIAGLPTLAVTLLSLSWIIVVFVLAVKLLSYLKKRETDDNPLVFWVHFGYIFLMILYVVLMILAILNPVVAWPIIVQYLVNILWAATLIYFRHRIKTLYF